MNMKGVIIFALASMAMLMSMSTLAAAAVAAENMPPPDGMNWNAIMAIGTVSSVVLSVISGGYTWLSNRDRVTAKRFDDQHRDFEKRFNELEREQHKSELRVKELEGKLNAMPTNVQMGELYRNVAEIDGDMKAANATLKGIDTRMGSFEAIAGRIEKFLLNQAEGKGSKR